MTGEENKTQYLLKVTILKWNGKAFEKDLGNKVMSSRFSELLSLEISRTPS